MDRLRPAAALLRRPATNYRGESVKLIDAKQVDLSMLDRMYKEYPTAASA
jgi:hypothetical protein